MIHTILVYGTLRPFTNTDIVKVPGKLYDLGWYPGIVLGNHDNPEEGDSFVTCERITVDDKRLAELDRYEGYYERSPESSLYLRKKIGQDWIYVYNHSVEGHSLIESGDWQKYTQGPKECRFHPGVLEYAPGECGNCDMETADLVSGDYP